MSFSSIQHAITTHFATNWQNRLPVDYDNLPPNHKGNDDIWCRFYFDFSGGAQQSLGGTATHAWSGYIVVQLFVMKNIGADDAWDYAEHIRTIMQRRTLEFDTSGRIYTHTPTVKHAGDEPFQINVVTPFEARQLYDRISD